MDSLRSKLPTEVRRLVHVANLNGLISQTYSLDDGAIIPKSKADLQHENPDIAGLLDIGVWHEDIQDVLKDGWFFTKIYTNGVSSKLDDGYPNSVPQQVKDRTIHIERTTNEIDGITYLQKLVRTFPKVERIDIHIWQLVDNAIPTIPELLEALLLGCYNELGVWSSCADDDEHLWLHQRPANLEHTSICMHVPFSTDLRDLMIYYGLRSDENENDEA